MRKKKEIQEMIVTMERIGRESTSNIERTILAEKMGTLMWVLDNN